MNHHLIIVSKAFSATLICWSLEKRFSLPVLLHKAMPKLIKILFCCGDFSCGLLSSYLQVSYLKSLFFVCICVCIRNAVFVREIFFLKHSSLPWCCFSSVSHGHYFSRISACNTREMSKTTLPINLVHAGEWWPYLWPFIFKRCFLSLFSWQLPFV